MNHRLTETVICLMASLAGSVCQSPDSTSEPLLDAMRKLNEQTSVTIADGLEPVQAELQRQPVFRYSDQVRGIQDAGLWLWTHAGRPVAFQKIEATRDLATNKRNWTYCFTTASE